MAKILIDSAIIFVITCYWLKSVNAGGILRKGENTEDSRKQRDTEVTNFIELKNLRRPFLIVQTDIIPNKCVNFCDGKPMQKKLAENHQPMLYPGLDSTKCEGWLENCLYLSGMSGKTGNYCVSERNVIWAQDSSHKEYGKKDNCAVKTSSPKKINHSYCHTCLCMCTEGSRGNKNNSNWAFSLEPQLSDIKNQRIVVGVRFRAVNNLIHLEIKEGSLTSHGEGNWKTLVERPNLLRNIDYSPLTPENRSIQLDEIILPSNYVVTGVKFTRKSTKLDSQKKILRMEVQGHQVDVTSGKLVQNSSTWYNSDDMNSTSTADQQNESRSLKTGDDGDNDESILKPKSIIFEDTGFTSGKELRIIPYLAKNDIQSESNLPLGGVGLIRRKDGDNEYIIPKVVTSYVYIEAADMAEPNTTGASSTTVESKKASTTTGASTIIITSATTTAAPTTTETAKTSKPKGLKILIARLDAIHTFETVAFAFCAALMFAIIFFLHYLQL